MHTAYDMRRPDDLVLGIGAAIVLLGVARVSADTANSTGLISEAELILSDVRAHLARGGPPYLSGSMSAMVP